MEAFSLGVEWLGCETEFSLPTTREFKNEWRYISTPLYAFMICMRTSFTLHIALVILTIPVFQSRFLSKKFDLI
jgi:hypothetical protein